MAVDEFTVVAQLINFALLVWLLKRVLYAPLLAAMDRRRQRIEAAQSTAEQARAEAERMAAEYRLKLAELDSLRQARLGELQAELERHRSERLKAIGTEAEAVQAQWRQRLEQEQSLQAAALRSTIQDRVLAICRKTLSDLAGIDLEIAMARSLLARLRKQSPERELRVVLEQGCRVRSRYPLPPSVQAELSQGICAWAGLPVTITFEPDAEAPPGLSLLLHDRRLGWSTDDYLDDFAAALPGAVGRV